MSRDTGRPFDLTEWVWFKTQLRLYAMERKGPLFNVRFDFDDKERAIVCSLYNSSLGEILEEMTDKATLYDEYFSGWVRSERKAISRILTELPALGTELDLERNVVFRILWDYGTGSDLVCTITGSELLWKWDPAVERGESPG